MSEFDVPIMLGLIPLKALKWLHTSMKKCLELTLLKKSWTAWKKVVKEAGTEIAIETLEQIKKMAAGVHIMPLNDIDTTLYIIDHV